MDHSRLTGKKRKNPPEHVPQQPTPKKSKRDRKPRALDDTQPRSSEFRQVEASLDITLPPMFIGDPLNGIRDMLDSMLMQYIPTVQGVLLSHSNLAFTSNTALILPDSPFARCTITFKALVWSPRVGMKLKGRINLCSPDHVSLLVHRTFNVSILRQHLPFEEYEFEYGPAENDPEFGVRIASETTPAGQEGTGEDQGVRDPGRWVHRKSGAPLGGVERTIEFTVIGAQFGLLCTRNKFDCPKLWLTYDPAVFPDRSLSLQFRTVSGLTIANGMLSLLGSTLSDPFAPNLKQAPPQSVSRKTRHEQEVVEVDSQGEGDVPNAESNLRVENDDPFTALVEGTDRLIESTNADVAVGPAVESVNARSGEKAAKAEKKRKRNGEKAKTKEADGERPALKKKKKKKAQP